MVKIKWHDIQELNPENNQRRLIWFRYNNGKNHQFYVNWQKEKAEQEFIELLNQRSVFEIEREGWNVEGFVLNFSENGQVFLCEEGAVQFLDLSQMLLNGLGKNRKPSN